MLVDFGSREIFIRIVYFGHAGSSHLQQVLLRLGKRDLVEVIEMPNGVTELEETMEIPCGNWKFVLNLRSASEKSSSDVLQGTDGVIFVADSSPNAMTDNQTSWNDLMALLSYSQVPSSIIAVLDRWDQRNTVEYHELRSNLQIDESIDIYATMSVTRSNLTSLRLGFINHFTTILHLIFNTSKIIVKSSEDGGETDTQSFQKNKNGIRDLLRAEISRIAELVRRKRVTEMTLRFPSVLEIIFNYFHDGEFLVELGLYYVIFRIGMMNPEIQTQFKRHLSTLRKHKERIMEFKGLRIDWDGIAEFERQVLIQTSYPNLKPFLSIFGKDLNNLVTFGIIQIFECFGIPITCGKKEVYAQCFTKLIKRVKA